MLFTNHKEHFSTSAFLFDVLLLTPISEPAVAPSCLVSKISVSTVAKAPAVKLAGLIPNESLTIV